MKHLSLSLVVLFAAVLAAPVFAQPKVSPILQKVPFVSNVVSNPHPGNAVCLPPGVVSFPNVGYAVGKTSVSAADITLFVGTMDPPDPPNAAEMTPYTFSFLAGKCYYTFAYPNINPGIADLAQIVAEHNPNVYMIVSKRQDCWTFDKTLYTDPLFANVEYECEIRFHGVIAK